MKQIKRFFAIILSLSILVTLLPSIALTANATEQWLWPAEGCYVVSSNFGHRKWWSSTDQAWREDYHKGIDIVGDNGTLGQPVRATKSGTIYDSCNTIADNQHISGSRGNFVAIDHGDGTCSMYMHLRPYNVKTSGSVQQGEIIGYIGNTGDSDGAHLHFQLYTNRNNPSGSLINPMPTNSQIRINNKNSYAVPSDWPQDWITYVFSASPFTVETPTNISMGNATINCWADNNGTMTQIGFYFGSSPEHMNRYVVTDEEVGWTRFRLSYSISDYCGLLLPGCTYSYQFFYVNENGESKSEIAEVATAGAKVVSFDSYSLSNITETGAIVGAWLDNPNGYQLSSIGIEYGEYRDEMTSVEIVKNVGWTRAHLDYNLHDLGIYLLSGHTFYIKYYADVNGTRYYSDDFIVTTGAIVKYDTFAISDISSTSALISAWISNPYGYQFSQIGFEYGESKTKYTRVLVTTNVSWTRAHLQYDFASFGVSLKPGTQYYYRFYSIVGDSIYYSARQSFVTKDSPCATGHSYTYKVTTAPTTSAPGVLAGTCSRCSSTTTVTLPKLNTTDYTYAVTKAATCTATGTGRYTWKTTTYGSFYFDVTIAKTSHTYTATVTAPTCTEKGYTTHTCTACGDSYKDTYTDALGHSWDDGVITTKPTETTEGVKTFSCSRCGATKTEPVPVLDHTHAYTPNVTAPTCTAQGYTTYTCSCGDSYVTDYVAALGHNWDDGIVTTKPTETSEGIKTFTCSRCGATRTESVPALGHTHSYLATITPPTCTEKGYTTYTCACGDSYVTDYIGALGHDFVDGVCARCGEADPNYNPPTPKDPCEGYTDINRNKWYHEAADFVISRGLMGSTQTNAKTFEPDTKVSRAMVASILYRMAGSPAVSYKGTFSDVKNGKWFTTAIEWCAQNGLASGKGDGIFDPNGNVTRQELAVFMMKLTQYLGKPTEGRDDLSSFADAGSIPSWAKDYVKWAVSAGLISGKSSGGTTYLAPKDNATRAEFASIIMRFVQNIAEAK